MRTVTVETFGARAVPFLVLVAGCGAVFGPGDEDAVHVCADGSGDFTSIGAAIAMAEPGQVIAICAGVYEENLAVVGSSVRLRGAGPDATIVDGGGKGTVLTLAGGAMVAVEGMTLRGGVTNERGAGISCSASGLDLRTSMLIDNRAEGGGGGLGAVGCAVSLDGVRFERNEGTAQGGGALLTDSSGELTLTTFYENTADAGGGIVLENGSVTLRDVELRRNTARVHGGGMVQASDGLVEDCEIVDNIANWIGGGVYVLEHAPTFRANTITDNYGSEEGGGFYLHHTAAVLEANTISDNSAQDDGGGLRIFESTPTLVGNTISGNRAGGDGGGYKISHLPGVFADNQVLNNSADGAGGGAEHDNDSSQVRGGTFQGNTASMGGGLHLGYWPWEGGLIADVKIADNHAWVGGGIYAEDGFKAATLRGLTVFANTADRGAGLYSTAGWLILRNSLFAGNEAGSAGGGLYLTASEPWTSECPCPPPNPPSDIQFVVIHDNRADDAAAVWSDAPNLTVSSSIVSGHQGTAVVTPLAPSWTYVDTYPASFSGMPNPTGTNGNLSTEPRFVDAEDGDFRLEPVSACIDAGDPAFTDPDGSRADMGLHAGPEAK